jgi:hypothetical protein
MRIPTRNTTFALLTLVAACFTSLATLHADQSAADAATLLTTGHWKYHGVNRTFYPDGTFKSATKNRGTWQIANGVLTVTLGAQAPVKGWVVNFPLPLDPKGTKGADESGRKEVLSMVDAKTNPTGQAPENSAASEFGTREK